MEVVDVKNSLNEETVKAIYKLQELEPGTKEYEVQANAICKMVEHCDKLQRSEDDFNERLIRKESEEKVRKERLEIEKKEREKSEKDSRANRWITIAKIAAFVGIEILVPFGIANIEHNGIFPDKPLKLRNRSNKDLLK